MQLTDNARAKLHRNLTERILNAQEEISKMNPSTDEKQINYLKGRIDTFTLSVLVIYNTDRIKDDRALIMHGLKAQLAAELGPNERLIKERKYKELKKASNCKHCYRRGWIGFNIATGEYSFCTCTLRTMHHYIK